MQHLLQIPDLRDAEAMQKFFLQEIQLGEELLGTGESNNLVSARHSTATDCKLLTLLENMILSCRLLCCFAHCVHMGYMSAVDKTKYIKYFVNKLHVYLLWT